jgi:hypothetical protein
LIPLSDIKSISASDIEVDNLGKLKFYSSWTVPLGNNEVFHTVPVQRIFIDPERVLYWNGQADRLCNRPRFSYLLGVRAVAELISVEYYHDSLLESSYEQGFGTPPKRRLGSLMMLAAKYKENSSLVYPTTRLATSTAHILFNYQPPEGQPLADLHQLFLGQLKK